MLRTFKLVLAAALALLMADAARAFSLLGLYDTYQTAQLGYRQGADLGGPMSLSEGYRWNVPIITYAFDESFLHFFGMRGVEEVEKAIRIMNELPAASQMTTNLTEFPLDSTRINYRAQALGILDLKSYTLETLLEEMGLAQPERWVWCLRDRLVTTVNNVSVTNYTVIQRNYDPVTWEPTKLVNGAMYSYIVREPLLPGNYADAVEFPVDPLAITYTSVAYGGATPGSFYTGITRDDAGGLRYLYRLNNYAVENLAANVTPAFGGSSGSGYAIWFGTNFVGNTNFGGGGTNIVISQGLRGGLDKISFVRIHYDSLLTTTLLPYAYDYTDTVITNYTAVSQYLRRSNNVPDILFTAEDLGLIPGTPYPLVIRRTIAMTSNDAINGQTAKAGPGIIEGPIRISFSFLLPAYLNDNFFLDEATATRTEAWGSFDGTTNAPVIYPNQISIQALERQVLGR